MARDLADLYPASAHVSDYGLLGSSDHQIWTCAASEGFVLVTKDDDFHRLSVLYGAPPKVIWIRLGNCSTADVRRLLRQRADEVKAFSDHPEASFLALGR